MIWNLLSISRNCAFCKISGGILRTFASKRLTETNISSNMSRCLCRILGIEHNNYIFLNFHSKRIKSLNNGRNYTGTTYVEKEDKEHSQRIRVTDQGEYIIRIDFEEDEYYSNDPFCRDISEIISRKKFCV